MGWISIHKSPEVLWNSMKAVRGKAGPNISHCNERMQEVKQESTNVAWQVNTHCQSRVNITPLTPSLPCWFYSPSFSAVHQVQATTSSWIETNVACRDDSPFFSVIAHFEQIDSKGPLPTEVGKPEEDGPEGVLSQEQSSQRVLGANRGAIAREWVTRCNREQVQIWHSLVYVMCLRPFQIL